MKQSRILKPARGRAAKKRRLTVCASDEPHHRGHLADTHPRPGGTFLQAVQCRGCFKSATTPPIQCRRLSTSRYPLFLLATSSEPSSQFKSFLRIEAEAVRRRLQNIAWSDGSDVPEGVSRRRPFSSFPFLIVVTIVQDSYHAAWNLLCRISVIGRALCTLRFGSRRLPQQLPHCAPQPNAAPSRLGTNSTLAPARSTAASIPSSSASALSCSTGLSSSIG